MFISLFLNRFVIDILARLSLSLSLLLSLSLSLCIYIDRYIYEDH